MNVIERKLQTMSNETVTLVGNSEGRLRVQRQVEDYAYRGVEFEEMGFLTFTVETYESRENVTTVTLEENRDDEDDHLSRSENGCYLNNHPKANTHIRVCRG